MESILTTNKETCYVCQRSLDAYGMRPEVHHIFYGHGLRNVSDRLGLVVYLCPECHRGTNGVHGKNGKALNYDLKQIAQHTYEETHNREEWMKEIGKNYL